MENNSPIFIAIPTHDFKIDVRMANVLYQKTTKQPHVIATQNSSLLAMNCNNLWVQALSNRSKYGFKWFAMLHSDIVPQDYWLDKMIAIAEQNDADLLSAVVPIKSSDGITSTAITKPDGTGVWRRLTQTEVMDTTFPETFSVHDLPFLNGVVQSRRKLVVNTGCMICRIDQPWSDEVHFTINDGIERNMLEYKVTVEPEDWFFSRLVAEKGGRVMATKAVRVHHIGQNAFDSHAVWGKAVDPLIEMHND